MLTISMFHYHVPFDNVCEKKLYAELTKTKGKVHLFFFEQDAENSATEEGPRFVVSERGTIPIPFPI